MFLYLLVLWVCHCAFSQLTKMHGSRFAFGYLESIYVCTMCYFIDALLQLTFCSSHIFWSGSETEGVNVKITINSRSKTPCNTVNSYIKQCHWQNIPLRDSFFLLIEIRKRWSDSDSELPIREKTLYKFGSLPRSPRLWRSFIIPNFQGVS